MRILSTITPAFCLALLGACGGCAPAGAAAAQTADISGKITNVDGSRVDLAGIVIQSLGDGATVVTGPDGSFRLAVRAGDPIVLRFEDPDNPRSEGPGSEEQPDAPEGRDATPDGSDIDGDQVELDPLEEDESCEIEVELENGDVVECRVDRPDPEGGERRRIKGECKLRPPEGSSEAEAVAEAELVCEGNCCVLEVEVGRVRFAQTLTVAIECEEAIEEIGTLAIREGGGHFEIDSCDVDVLPLGVASVYDLRGCTLLLLDEAGSVALLGCVPGEREEEQREREEEEEGSEGEGEGSEG